MSFDQGVTPEPLADEARLPPRERWALFLDIDGTLLDLAATPDSVVVPPSLRIVLPALAAAFDGALALVSGRALASIDRLFAPLSLTAAGQHGAEIRRQPHGPTVSLIDSAKILAAAAALKPLEATHPGVLVEDKGLSIAVHYRNAPAAEPLIRAAVEEQARLSDGALEVLGGKMVWDLHPYGLTKGTALELLLGTPPFAGRIPVFIGDDLTDEFGFTAAARQGGVGILVGERRETTATFRLPNPSACRNWLGSLV